MELLAGTFTSCWQSEHGRHSLMCWATVARAPAQGAHTEPNVVRFHAKSGISVKYNYFMPVTKLFGIY